MATSVSAPQRIWGSSLSDAGVYAGKLTAAIDNIAFFVRIFWSGPTCDNSGVISNQSILFQGNSASDGYGFIINGQAAAPPMVASEVVILAGGVAWIGTGTSSNRLTQGAWNTIIFSRESGTWKLRINGVNKNPSQNPTATPNATSNVGAFGNNVNGIISHTGFWVGSGAAPLSLTNKTDLESGILPIAITPASGSLIVAHTLDGTNATTESDTSGNGNTLTITSTLILQKTLSSRSGLTGGFGE